MADAGRAKGRLVDVYARDMPRAMAIAYLITGDRNLAEDLAQEAFARLAGRFAHLRAPEAFDAYLRRTVVNLCFSHLRRRRVERAFLARERARPRTEETTAPDMETQDEVRRALLALPRRQRAAIVLRYYEDLPERQIADLLRCSIPAVKSLLARGMDGLRGRIGREPS